MTDTNTYIIDDGQVGDDNIVSAGKIHVLGLDAIKSRLGPKWERLSGLVHHYFDAAIRRELGPGDTFTHAGELSYLVLFRDVTLAEAQLKCAAAAEDVCRKLFGDVAGIAIRNLIAPVDSIALTNIQDQLRLNDVLEHAGRETIFGSQSKQAVPAAPPLRVQMGPASESVHTIARHHPEFVYRPLWDTSRSAVLTYLCQSLPDTLRANAPFSAPCLAVESAEEQAALDTLALRECLQRVATLRRAGLRVLLAAPLHAATICRPRSWSGYGAAAAAVPAELFRDIAFLVHGFEAGIPNARLVQELPKLSRLSKTILCLVEQDNLAGTQFRNTGAHAIGFAVQPGKNERHWIMRMNRMVREARANGLEAFVLGATTRSTAVNAIGAGLRYVEGPVVRPNVADPKHAFSHELEDLYRYRQDVA